MVSTLTSNPIFGSPLRTKSVLFSFIANRAVSLLTVFSIKLMTVFAMCSKGVLGSDRVAINERVFSGSNHPQVSDIHTMPILADVVNHHTFFNSTIMNKISNPMRSPIKFSEVKRAVAVFIKRAIPQMATVFFVPFRVKSGEFYISNHVTHSIPYVPCGSKGVNNG